MNQKLKRIRLKIKKKNYMGSKNSIKFHLVSLE